MADILSTASGYDAAMLAARTAQGSQSGKPAAGGNIDAAAKDFESMFVSEMLSHMFDQVEVDPEFGGGKGEEMFRSMMVNEYGKMISRGPGIGIADHVRRAMIEMQQTTDGGK